MHSSLPRDPQEHARTAMHASLPRDPRELLSSSSRSQHGLFHDGSRQSDLVSYQVRVRECRTGKGAVTIMFMISTQLVSMRFQADCCGLLSGLRACACDSRHAVMLSCHIYVDVRVFVRVREGEGGALYFKMASRRESRQL